MKNTSAIDHPVLISPEVTADEFQRCNALTGHKLIVARSSSGMSFQPEDLRRQRMLNRVNCSAADRSSLESTGTAFAEAITTQCTAKLCIKS